MPANTEPDLAGYRVVWRATTANLLSSPVAVDARNNYPAAGVTTEPGGIAESGQNLPRTVVPHDAQVGTQDIEAINGLVWTVCPGDLFDRGSTTGQTWQPSGVAVEPRRRIGRTTATTDATDSDAARRSHRRRSHRRDGSSCQSSNYPEHPQRSPRAKHDSPMAGIVGVVVVVPPEPRTI